MKIIGLTGGIASGKSAVARMLREAGVDVVDADVLAREAVVPGSPALAAIVERFGADVLLPDGSLDRKQLGAVVFSDESARADLNAIVHPRIYQLSADAFARLRAAGRDVAVYEMPLLFENGLEDTMDGVILVAASPQVQLARLMARDDSSADAAGARIASQLSLDEKRRRLRAGGAPNTRFVVDNNGSLEDTARQLSEAWLALTGRALG